jgi:exopolysaccharide production protein ExoY
VEVELENGIVTQTKHKEDVLTFSNLKNDSFCNSVMSAEVINEPSFLYKISKYLIDIAFSLLGLVVLMPILFIIALCIKLENRGSIFYKREMIGLRGKSFVMLKFRTMIPDAEGYLEKHPELLREYQQSMKLKYDPRITRMGRFLRKTYLDELPQLLNVLVGQMSLVGPRAIHQRELPLYGEYAQKRHSVKPGMTGLWQISPERHESYEDRIPFDMQYVDNCSFRNDLIILMKTLKVIIDRTGV